MSEQEKDKIPEEIRTKIHLWAAAGAATAAAFPVIVDSTALAAEEVFMVIQVGSYFGVSIDKAAAHGILCGAIASSVGVATFVTANAALEAADLAYPFSFPAKIGIAVGIVELVGIAAYRYFEAQSK